MKLLLVGMVVFIGTVTQAEASRSISSVSEASSTVGRSLATGQIAKMTDTPDNGILCGFHHNDRKRDSVVSQKQKKGVEARKGT